MGHQTNIPDIVSHPIEIQHNPTYVLSPLAKSWLTLKLSSSARRLLSTIKEPLEQPCTLLVIFPQKVGREFRGRFSLI